LTGSDTTAEKRSLVEPCLVHKGRRPSVIDQSLLSRASSSSGLQNESTGIRSVGDQDNPLDSSQIRLESDPRALRPPVIQGLHQLVQQSAASFQEENVQSGSPGSSKTVLENFKDCTEGSEEQSGLEHVGKQTLASNLPADCYSQSGAELVGQESVLIYETGDHSGCLPGQSDKELLSRHPVVHLETGDLVGGLNQSDVESLAHQPADVQEESELPAELDPPPIQSKLSVGQETKANSGDLPGFELKDGSDERASRQLVRGNESSSDLVSGVSETHSGLNLLELKDKESSDRQSGDNFDDQQSTDVRDVNILLEEKDIRTGFQPGDAQKAAAIDGRSLPEGVVQSGSQPSAVSEDDSVLLEAVIGRPELNPKVLQLKEQHKACVLSLGPCVKSRVHRGSLLALPVQSDLSSLSNRVEENEGCDLVDPEPEDAFVTSGRSADMSQLDSRGPVMLQVEAPPPEVQSTAELDGRDKLQAQIESVPPISPGKLDQVSEDRNCRNVEVWYRTIFSFFFI
jgi:hypothetical protein